MRISDWSSDVCSSDLARRPFSVVGRARGDERHVADRGSGAVGARKARLAMDDHLAIARNIGLIVGGQRDAGDAKRSEEHTSELQSLMRISYAVFCLKKKNTNTYTYDI